MSGNHEDLSQFQQRSEVARLLEQIDAEYEAARRGLKGLAGGTTRHAFIQARMEHIGQMHSQLQSLVGDQAIALIADRIKHS